MKTNRITEEKAPIGKSSRPFVEKVAVIGAGVGGLATAIALRKQGFDVQVYEKARALRPIGSSISLLPNGLSSLNAIAPGIIESLKRSSTETRKFFVKNIATGQTQSIPIDRLFLEKNNEYPFCLTIWWWKLQQILASRVPSEIIHLNHHFVGFEQNDQGVEVFFDGGKRVYANLLIGADGLNSVVRETLIGDGKPRYVGSMFWRSIVKYNNELFFNSDEMFILRGNDNKIMYFFDVGDEYVAWVCRKSMPEYSLSRSADEAKSRVLDEFGGWGENLRAILEATEAEQILEGLICDRPPLTSWSRGRVTLLGDAAHVMAPALSQGANTTFEDAYELARSLSESSSLKEALSNYEKQRIPRTQTIQSNSAIIEKSFYEADDKTYDYVDHFRDEYKNLLQSSGAVAQ